MKYTKENEMKDDSLESLIAVLATKLVGIEDIKQELKNLTVDVKTVATTVNNLSNDYAIRNAKNDAKLESIHEVVTKQNSRIYKLEEVTTKDRESHLSCPAHTKIAVLDQKINENKESIQSIKQSSTQSKATRISIISVAVAAFALMFNVLKEVLKEVIK